MIAETKEQLLEYVSVTLREAHLEYEHSRKRRVSLQEFAQKYFGMYPSTFNRYYNGNQLPDLGHALQLSQKLGPEFAGRLGYRFVYDLSDPALEFIAVHWGDIDKETRDVIYNHVKEETEKANVHRRQTVQGGGSPPK